MHKSDFAVDQRLIRLSLFALVIGVLSTASAWLLLTGIRFFTNLFFFQSQPVVSVLSSSRFESALATENCRSVAARMAALGLERLPVIESSESARLIGIVSRSDLLGVARHVHEEEWKRERWFARDA